MAPAAYNQSASATTPNVVIPGAALGASLVATSLVETLGLDLSFGEVATVGYAVTLPEGSTPVQLVLPYLPSAFAVTGFSLGPLGAQLVLSQPPSGTTVTLPSGAVAFVVDFGVVLNLPDGIVDAGDVLGVAVDYQALATANGSAPLQAYAVLDFGAGTTTAPPIVFNLVSGALSVAQIITPVVQGGSVLSNSSYEIALISPTADSTGPSYNVRSSLFGEFRARALLIQSAVHARHEGPDSERLAGDHHGATRADRVRDQQRHDNRGDGTIPTWGAATCPRMDRSASVRRVEHHECDGLLELGALAQPRRAADDADPTPAHSLALLPERVRDRAARGE